MATLRDKLRESLKKRVKRDVGEDRFDPANWNTTELGKLYEEQHPDIRLQVIQTALRESFEPVLNDNDVTVSEPKWKEYFKLVKVDDTPKSALNTLIDILV
ncbi:MAG: hypothetical protein JSS81_01605 [Acidobacteria bacterium]|nr:hypothetical protein [Acidobacteriota bacterium]